MMNYEFLADYEWHYYIGGNCALKRKKYDGLLATITHTEQGVYEAAINRKNQDYPLAENFFVVGVFNDSNEAQEVINTILEERFNEDTSAVCRVD